MSLALGPVSVGVYTLLNVASLTALAPGGVFDDAAQGTTFPFVFYEVSESNAGGFGTGYLPEVSLRVHAFSQYGGMKIAQSIISKVIDLLKDQSVTVSGYTHCGRIFYDETTVLPDEMVNGMKCHELVAQFRIYVEAA